MNPDIPVIKIMISKINTFIQVGLESIKKKNLPSICHFLFHTTVLQWIPEYKGLKFINTILIYLLFFILDGSETIIPDRAKRSDLDPQHCFLQNFLLDFLLLPFWSSIPYLLFLSLFFSFLFSVFLTFSVTIYFLLIPLLFYFRTFLKIIVSLYQLIAVFSCFFLHFFFIFLLPFFPFLVFFSFSLSRRLLFFSCDLITKLLLLGCENLRQPLWRQEGVLS